MWARGSRESSCWCCVLSRGSTQEGEDGVVKCHDTCAAIWTCSELGGCRAGPGSGELGSCLVSSCGWIGWAVGAWTVSFWIGLQCTSSSCTAQVGVFLRKNSSASRSGKSWVPHLWALEGKDVQQHDGMAGGLGRLSRGQTGIVYHEELTSSMEGGETQ